MSKVRIAARLRPFIKEEARDESIIVGTNFISVENPHVAGQAFKYSIPSCYGQMSSQEQVFKQDVSPLLDEVFKGLTVTVFAYGVTSSGKTHTMQGTAEEPGIIPRVISALFTKCEEYPLYKISFQWSYMEIYKDECFDLLVPRAAKLPVRENGNGKVVVANLTWNPLQSAQEFDAAYATACKARSVGSTNLNHNSSRSHAILGLTVTCVDEGGGRTLTGRINLVDLAGSENNNLTGNDRNRMQESAAINKSLAVLGQVVHALNQGASRIPYRDSKLTRILQDALGGQSVGLLICNLAPGTKFRQDTLNTLNFASRTKQVENRPVVAEKANPPKMQFAAAVINGGSGKQAPGPIRRPSLAVNGKIVIEADSEPATKSESTASGKPSGIPAAGAGKAGAGAAAKGKGNSASGRLVAPSKSAPNSRRPSAAATGPRPSMPASQSAPTTAASAGPATPTKKATAPLAPTKNAQASPATGKKPQAASTPDLDSKIAAIVDAQVAAALAELTKKHQEEIARLKAEQAAKEEEWRKTQEVLIQQHGPPPSYAAAEVKEMEERLKMRLEQLDRLDRLHELTKRTSRDGEDEDDYLLRVLTPHRKNSLARAYVSRARELEKLGELERSGEIYRRAQRFAPDVEKLKVRIAALGASIAEGQEGQRPLPMEDCPPLDRPRSPSSHLKKHSDGQALDRSRPDGGMRGSLSRKPSNRGKRAREVHDGYDADEMRENIDLQAAAKSANTFQDFTTPAVKKKRTERHLVGPKPTWASKQSQKATLDDDSQTEESESEVAVINAAVAARQQRQVLRQASMNVWMEDVDAEMREVEAAMRDVEEALGFATPTVVTAV